MIRGRQGLDAASQSAERTDDIGNRLLTTGSREDGIANYTVNLLNQYVQRTVPRWVDVLGSAHTGATVTVRSTVGGSSAYPRAMRPGDYFHTEVPVPTYDDDGNLLSDGRLVFTWDAENRLTSASNAATVVEFAYDFMGRRVRKTVDGTNVTRFAYDGWALVREVAAGGAVASTNSAVWGIDMSGTLQGAGGVGGLVAAIRDDTLYLAACDGNGNVTEYVTTNGTVAAHLEYDPFGNTLVATGDSAEAFPHRFSTKYGYPETDLYYYGHRFYSPSLGRWMSRDPIGEWGGVAVYVFVGNGPVGHSDAHGLLIFEPNSGNAPPSRVSRPCCDGIVYDPEVQCCCLSGKVQDGSGAKLVKRSEIETGITKHKYTGEPTHEGTPVHYWIRWGDESADANASAILSGQPGNKLVAFPAGGAGLPNHPTPVKLSPCAYDFKRLQECLTEEAKKLDGERFGLCEAFVNHMLNTCKKKSAGCTVQ